MLKIHSTKKLLAKLPLDGSGMLTNTRANADARAAGDSPLGSWHANLLTLQRHNCILFVHDATRFPVFLKELLNPDFAELAWHFEDGFMNTLLKAGADDAQMQAPVNALRPLQFDNDYSLSFHCAYFPSDHDGSEYATRIRKQKIPLKINMLTCINQERKEYQVLAGMLKLYEILGSI